VRLLPPHAAMTGSVYLRGIDLAAMSEAQLQGVRGRDIGMVFQEPMTALDPLMRIGDQVAETVRLYGSARAAEAEAMARQALDSAGLRGAEGALERYPHELSGGQRQRVAIAMAIVLSPPLLIADEPTTALDAVTQAEVLSLLRGFARARRMAVILVSHDLAVISEVTDRIAVMHGGEIVEQLATADLLKARHPYTRALLAAATLGPKRAASAPQALVQAPRAAAARGG